MARSYNRNPVQERIVNTFAMGASLVLGLMTVAVVMLLLGMARAM